MATSDQPGSGNPVPSVQEQRSENLLPDEGEAEDGRFEVAEEVNLDQQSDEARRVGQLPPGGLAGALSESLKSQESAPGADASRK